MVAFFHIGLTSWANAGSAGRMIVGYRTPELAWVNFGWVGVEIFFVISGFVIANSANGRDFWQFARSRILRLYPGVWICAMLTGSIAVILRMYSVPDFINRFVHSILILPIYPWIDGVYWTLGVEIIFYILIGIFVSLDKFHRVNILAGYLSISSLAYSLSGLDFGVQWSRVTLLAHGSFFALGIYFWRFSVRGRFDRMTIISIAACILEIINHAEFVSEQTHTPRGYGALAVWCIGMAWILISWYFPNLFKITERFSLICGRMTYPLYLVHFTAGIALSTQLAKVINPVWSVLLSVVTMVFLAMFISEMLEPRLRKLLDIFITFVEERLRFRARS